MICTICKKTNVSDAKFCNQCGASINQESFEDIHSDNDSSIKPKTTNLGWQIIGSQKESETQKQVKENNLHQKYELPKANSSVLKRLNKIFSNIPLGVFLLLDLLFLLFSYILTHLNYKIIYIVIWVFVNLIIWWRYKRIRNKKINATSSFFQGEVRGFKERSEALAQGLTRPGNNITVWNFRLERYEEGQHLNPIPVEMRGHEFSGFINEGDTIKLSSNWKSGIHLTKKVFNVTNGSWVTAKKKGYPLVVRILTVTVLILVLAVFGYFLIGILSGL